MRITEEKTLHLCTLTGLDPDHAREALEESGGDELEALTRLVQRGTVSDAQLGFYSTAEQTAEKGGPLVPVRRRRAVQRGNEPPLEWGERVWLFFVGNRLVARHRDDARRRIECPLGALLALLVIAWYVVVGVLLLGLALGWRYHLAGPQLGRKGLQALLARARNRLRRGK